MTTRLVGKRIKALHEEHKLSHENVAEIFGFNDRRTASAIETWSRRVTAEGLVLAVEKPAPLRSTLPVRFCSSGKASTPGGPVSARNSSKPANAAEGAGSRADRTLAPQVGREAPLVGYSLGPGSSISREHTRLGVALSSGASLAISGKPGELTGHTGRKTCAGSSRHSLSRRPCETVPTARFTPRSSPPPAPFHRTGRSPDLFHLLQDSSGTCEGIFRA